MSIENIYSNKMQVAQSTIRVVPATLNYNTIVAARKIRLAAYARVSTDSEDQLNSFVAQSNYYNTTLFTKEGIEYVGLYADEGITGTLIKKRKDFKRLIADCQSGKVDRIITKSVSRFARNVVECIKTARELREQGITILFEAEGIDTAQPGHETMLAFAATIAESSSRSSSENLLWRIKKKFQAGKVHMGKRVYGYEIEKPKSQDEADKFIIIPHQAEVIKRIYNEFIAGKSFTQIAKSLQKDSIPTPRSKTNWYGETISTILKNEKYVGDLILQKTYKADLLSDRKTNTGQKDKYYIENHHIPIIDRTLWNTVQAEIVRRESLLQVKNGRSSKVSANYPLSGKLHCSCGTIMRRFYWRSKNVKYPVFGCPQALDYKTCSIRAILENKIESAFVKVLNKLAENTANFTTQLSNNIDKVISKRQTQVPDELDRHISKIENRISNLQIQILELAKKFDRTQDDYTKGEQLCSEIDRLRQELSTIKNTRNTQLIEMQVKQTSTELLTQIALQPMTQFDPDVFQSCIDKIVVQSQTSGDKKNTTKTNIVFIFRGGVEIETII